MIPDDFESSSEFKHISKGFIAAAIVFTIFILWIVLSYKIYSAIQKNYGGSHGNKRTENRTLPSR